MDAVVKLSREKKWMHYGWICNEKERGEIKLIYSKKQIFKVMNRNRTLCQQKALRKRLVLVAGLK